MYEGGIGVAAATTLGATTTAVLLPNTGGSQTIIALAVAVLSGLLTWGLVYSRTNR